MFFFSRVPWFLTVAFTTGSVPHYLFFPELFITVNIRSHIFISSFHTRRHRSIQDIGFSLSVPIKGIMHSVTERERSSHQDSRMNENYDTDKFNFTDLTSPVVAIHICGYVNEKNEGDEDGNPPTNHWTTFLQRSDESSIRLDMTPGYGSDGQMGKIEIASKKYMHTNKAIKTLSFSVTQHATVRTITDLINNNGRDKYTFTEEWEGCRFWIYTLISDLEAAGIIPEGSVKATWEAVSRYWRYPSGSESRVIKKGKFRKEK